MRSLSVVCFVAAALIATSVKAQYVPRYTSDYDVDTLSVLDAPVPAAPEFSDAGTFDKTYAPTQNWHKGGCCDPVPKSFGLWQGFCHQGCGHHSRCGRGHQQKSHQWVGCGSKCGGHTQKAPKYVMPAPKYHAPKTSKCCAPKFHRLPIQLPKIDISPAQKSFSKLKACGCKTVLCKHGLFGLFHKDHGCKSCGAKSGCKGCKGGKSPIHGGNYLPQGSEVLPEGGEVIDPLTPPTPAFERTNEARRLILPNLLSLLPIEIN